MEEQKVSRRRFLADGMKMTGALAAAGIGSSCADQQRYSVHRRVLGANERVNVAMIGIRNQGGYHLQNYGAMENVRVKTLVDIDENLFAGRIAELEQLQSQSPGTEWDLRGVLDDKDIDAVSIATPDHWHALAAVWACQAGKDVYVEKPCAATIEECGVMIRAAEKYGRVMQVGLQNRSIANVRAAMDFLRSGGIGDVYMARTLCLKDRDSIGSYPDGPSEEEPGDWPLYGYPRAGRVRPCSSEYLSKVHYDLWLGPAPKRPYNRNRFHYNWHWFWDYGSGDIGNTSPHALDIAIWGMDRREHPVKVTSKGGYYVYKSDQQTPNVQTTTFEYADGKIITNEVRGIFTNGEAHEVRIGNLFYGSKGWLQLKGSEWRSFFGRDNIPGPSSMEGERIDPSILTGTGGGGHFANFISAVRAGDRSKLNCDIETGYMSTMLAHLGNISYRLGREVRFDGGRMRFVSDRQADGMVGREYSKGFALPKV